MCRKWFVVARAGAPTWFGQGLHGIWVGGRAGHYSNRVFGCDGREVSTWRQRMERETDEDQRTGVRLLGEDFDIGSQNLVTSKSVLTLNPKSM